MQGGGDGGGGAFSHSRPTSASEILHKKCNTFNTHNLFILNQIK